MSDELRGGAAMGFVAGLVVAAVIFLFVEWASGSCNADLVAREQLAETGVYECRDWRIVGRVEHKEFPR